MHVDLDQRKFRSIANTQDGDVSKQTVFDYRQEGKVVWATYSGGGIKLGNLVAYWIKNDLLEMRYQHLTTDDVFKTGKCLSRPETLTNGRLRMHETWQWTSGKDSSGTSIIEEF